MKVRVLFFVGLLVAAMLGSAPAAVQHGAVWEASYVAAMQPTFGNQGVPFSGTMQLKFNHGIISGTYRSDSVRPDPLRGRIVNVTGNFSESHLTLILQGANGFTVRGTLASDGKISGSTTIRGVVYTFVAKVKS